MGFSLKGSLGSFAPVIGTTLGSIAGGPLGGFAGGAIGQNMYDTQQTTDARYPISLLI